MPGSREGAQRPHPHPSKSSTAADEIFYLDNQGRETASKTLPAPRRFAFLHETHRSVLLSRPKYPFPRRQLIIHTLYSSGLGGAPRPLEDLSSAMEQPAPLGPAWTL